MKPIKILHVACGNSEIIKARENGYLENLQAPDLIIEELRGVFSSHERLPLVGHQTRQTVLSRFSPDRMGPQYKQLYLEIAQRRASRQPGVARSEPYGNG